jgi:glycosyltransferase involved in cell wall biosynthesis
MAIKKKEDSILRLGYFGRIHPVKGIHVLLTAIRLISAHYQLELNIYGIPEEDKAGRRYYDRLLKQSHQDKRIKWPGVLSQKNKLQIMSELDVLVIPSIWLETGPLVLLEAWASGTPVLGSRLGGIAELVSDGVGGLLFEPENPQDIARVMIRLFNEPDLLGKLRASIPKVRTMKEVAEEMERVYNRLRLMRRLDD